jgi:hypothetical protein
MLRAPGSPVISASAVASHVPPKSARRVPATASRARNDKTDATSWSGTAKPKSRNATVSVSATGMPPS